MTTFFIDPINGNDSNDALSYASAGKSLNNTSMRSTIVGGDEIRIVETEPQTILGGTAKFNYQAPPTSSDVKSVSGATNASPIVITTSAAHGFVTGDYVAISSVTGNLGANGIWKITKVDDTSFSLNNSVGNAAYTTGGSVRKRTGSIVEFSSQQVKNISVNGNQYQTSYPYCGQNWTQSTGINATINLPTSYITGSSQQIGVTATFTTGKIAYQNLGTTLDLSAYTHLNVVMSFATSTSIPADGVYYFALCSDTAGAVIVDQFSINNVAVSVASATPMKLIIPRDGGGNLGNNIKSIALYRSSSASGTANIVFENITAGLSPDSNQVNIKSALSLAESSGDGSFYGWYALAALNQDYAVLQSTNVYWNTTTPVYYQKNEPSAFYACKKIQGFDASGNTTTNTNYQILNFSDPATYINITGGWTRSSSMSVKASGGLSMWTNGIPLGTCINNNISTDNITYDSIAFCNWGAGLTIPAGCSNVFVSNCHFIGCATAISISAQNNINIGTQSDGTAGQCWFTENNNGISLSAYLSSVKNCIFLSGTVNPQLNNGGSSNCISNLSFYGCGASNQITHGAPCSSFDGITMANCYGLIIFIANTYSGFSTFKNIDISSNLGYSNTGIYVTSSNGNVFSGCSIDSCNVGVSLGICSSNSFFDTTITSCNNAIIATNSLNNNFNKCTGFTFPGPLFYSPSAIGSYVTFTNCTDSSSAPLDGIWYVDNCYITKSSAQSHSGTYSWGVYLGAYGSLYGWKNVNCPLPIKLSKIRCTANITYTVSVWVLRTDSTSQNAYLMCLGGQISGVINDVVSSNTSAVSDVWDQLTISFTPTENGVVEIQGMNYGSSTQLIHWDDINIVES